MTHSNNEGGIGVAEIHIGGIGIECQLVRREGDHHVGEESAAIGRIDQNGIGICASCDLDWLVVVNR